MSSPSPSSVHLPGLILCLAVLCLAFGAAFVNDGPTYDPSTTCPSVNHTEETP